jgi:hypothetical protein
VVFPGVGHGEQLGEALAEARDQPVLVVANVTLGTVLLAHEVGDDLHDQVVGELVHVQLDRMGDPVATPVVVELDLDRLVLLVDVAGEEVLDAGVLGERDVGAQIEQEALRIAERRGVAAVVGVLVVEGRPDALGVQPIGGAEAGHPGSKDDEVRHGLGSPDHWDRSGATRWA